MGRTVGRVRTLNFGVLLFLAASVFGQDNGVSTASSALNWENSTLEITLRGQADFTTGNVPARIYRVQQQLERHFPDVLFANLLPLQIDSVRTVGDAIDEEPELTAEISRLADHAHRGVPVPSLDLSTVSRQYRVPVFPDLAELFIGHRIPFRMERVISWIPTREFSGVVIYAVDQLPHRGTNQSVYLKPALLPEIFDTEMRPILEQDMLDPEAIRRWGVMAYTEDFDEDKWRDRIGPSPMRIMAREAFGVQPTDIVIDSNDADRILSSSHNRNLLRNGRILVILAPGQATAR